MITFKQYIAEKAMNKGEFAKTEKRQGGNAKVGFEFEMLIPHDSDLFQHDSPKYDPDTEQALTHSAIRGSLKNWISNGWTVVPDQSIDGDGIGAEVISPPTVLKDALKDLQQMFSWMKDNRAQTNITTGLHINISMPGIETVDLVKLVLFSGERHVLKSFDRLNNSFTFSQRQTIINNVTGRGTLPKEASAMIKLAKDSLSSEKYRSINIEKLKQGYLEFRIAGGVNYHKRFDEVKDTVLRFVSALEVALDPGAERQEYLKKLTKILGKAEEADENKDYDDRPISDLLELGDAEATQTNLATWLANAKAGKITGPATKKRMTEWVANNLLSSIYNVFLELGIKVPSAKHRAELKLILKRLGFEVSTLDLNDGDIAWIVKNFNLSK